MSYDPSQPTVYFDIGEAIAAIGILLAFISLANPTRQFRWKLGQFRLRTAYGLFFGGIACVLFAALLPVLPSRPAGIGGWPLFWEVFSGVLFACGSLGLLVSSTRPVKLTKWNGESFFRHCYSVIGRGEDHELGALAQEIAASAESVVNFAMDYNQHHAYVANEKGQKYDVPKHTQWACRLMDLWSDRRFCNVIVTRCPGTAIEYFHAIQNKRLYDSGGYSFVQQLINEAFDDPNSILHREERYSGLGHFLPFTETVFGNYRFADSRFRPLQAAGFQHTNLRNIEKYIQCLQRVTKAYFDSGDYHGNTTALWCGIDILVKSAGAVVARLREGERPAKFEDGPIWALSRISDGFQELIKLAKQYETKLPDYPFDPNTTLQQRDYSVYEILARGIYEYFEELASIDGHDWNLRHAAIDVWLDLYSPSAGPECRTVIEIQKRLEVLLWEQVNKNLEEKLFCYPMITKLLVSITGLQDRQNGSDGIKRVFQQLHRLLKEHFRQASQLDEKRSRDLLPEGYEYDKEKNVILVKDRLGSEIMVFNCD